MYNEAFLNIISLLSYLTTLYYNGPVILIHNTYSKHNVILTAFYTFIYAKTFYCVLEN
jgi:hypothetical protein